MNIRSSNKCNYCGAPVNYGSIKCSFCGQRIQKVIRFNLRVNREDFEIKNIKANFYLITEDLKKNTNKLKNRSILLLNKIQLYGRDNLENLNKVIRRELKNERTKKIISVMPYVIVILFSGSIITTIIVRNARNKLAEDLFNEGLKSLNSNSYSSAKESFTKALEISPGDYRIIYQLGLTNSNLGKYRTAIKNFNKAIEIAPKSYIEKEGIFFEKGSANYRMGNYSQAISDYRIYKLKRENYAVNYNLCLTNYNLGYYNQSILDCSRSIELNSRNADAYYMRALSKRKRAGKKATPGALLDKKGYCKDIDQSVKLGTKILGSIHKNTIHKNYKVFCSNLEQEILSNQIKEKEKEKEQKRKEKEDKLSKEAKYYLSRLKETYGERKDCSDTISLSNLLIPEYNSDISYYYRAKGNFLCRNYLSSISDYSKAIELDSGNVEYYKGRASAKNKSDDFKGAVDDYTRAINILPDSGLYQSRGFAYYKLTNYPAAISDYKKSIRIKPSSSSYGWLAQIHFKLAKYVDAIDYANKAIKLNKYSWSLYVIRGNSKYMIKDYSAACSDWVIYSRRSTYSSRYNTPKLKRLKTLNKLPGYSASIDELYRKSCK